jgi:hypothetical protein
MGRRSSFAMISLTALLMMSIVTIIPLKAFATALTLSVGQKAVLFDCGEHIALETLDNTDTNADVLTIIWNDFCSPKDSEHFDVTCFGEGTATLTIGVRNTQTGAHSTLVYDITCTMFVVPESPIGIIALMGSSLAALGGFMFWKRRSKSNPTDGMTGLGI